MTDLVQLDGSTSSSNMLLISLTLLLLILLFKLLSKNREMEKNLAKQNQLEKELRQNRDYLGKVIDSTEIGFGTVIDRTMVKVNQQLCNISGYSEDELVGSNTRLLYKNDHDSDRCN